MGHSESVGSYREKLATTLMMIDHVAIVTDNLASARKFYAGLGLKVTRVYNVTEQFQEEPRPHRYRAVAILFPDRDSVLWVMQPVGRTGPLRRFLKRHGPGLHHLGLRVKRMEHDYPRLRSVGIRFMRQATKFETEIRAIINPHESQGVLIELVERLPKTKRAHH